MVLPACGLLDDIFGSTSDGGTLATGFGQPELEVTVNGSHFGPAALDTGSAASLVTTYDSTTGHALVSNFFVTASSGLAGASCSLGVTSQGDGITPIGAGSFQVVASDGTTTAAGTVTPAATETVTAQGGSLVCSGSQCNGASLVILALDSSHVEGYYSGTMVDQNANGSSVVCSFYLPWSQYQP
jgi:hypothetical protein